MPRRPRPLRSVLREIDDANRAARILPSVGVVVGASAAGQTIAPDPPEDPVFWARLDAAGTGANLGLYDWTRMVPNVGTAGFAATSLAGSIAAGNPAVEANLAGGITAGTIVWAYLWGGQVRFQLEMC